MLCCALCGSWLEKSVKPTWRREYRAIYVSGVNIYEATLSGVGRFEGSGRKYLPAESNRRYDDVDFNESARVEFRYRFHKGGSRQGDSPPRVWGFVFHAACWDIITILFQPDVQLIFSLCFSMPIHGEDILDWGHDYGGIVIRMPYNESPPLLTHIGPGIHGYGNDPYTMCSIQKLFKSANIPEHMLIDIPIRDSPIKADGDVFHHLPNELLQAILVELPRQDVRRLRRASPVFANLHLSETFWASRFWRGHEFHHIFETLRSRPDSWQKLYLALRYIKPRLADRQRIWSLALELESLQNQVSDTVCKGARLLTAFDTSKNGRIKKNKHTSDWKELEPLFARIVRFGPRLRVRHLWVSFVRMSGRSFVSGFRFVKPNGKINSLGYIHTDQEVKIRFSDGRHESPYTISGWQLAVERQGFRAVAVLTADGTMSHWVGEPDNVPRWRLGGPGKRISAVKAEFDALKLVSLSRNVKESENIVDRGFDPEEYAWKPDLPPEHIFLNHPDDYVTDGAIPWPLETIMFGGPRGELLSQLTEIVIYTNSLCTPCIEFLYTDPSKNMFIGDADYVLDTYEGPKRSILIDGPGGERIVDAKMRNEGQRDDDLLLQTNRGREFLLGDPRFRSFKPWDSFAPGSLVIGFFHIDTVPIGRIGVMSINPETNGNESEAKEAHEGD
ncbi:uncharacterized protein NECHADRAFT_99093 [Fusarium vanettenii 77-13-4]|uniref:F-box domain-containing protein n=1 Tax=Fusarium vanettenii (strain ATCC MYA-4622 / CBS 123669 / FGSC 9596 / NRRL 45880 / 77-13-4) TaxID=660122 RepID=C7Z684_FUSV7|nr:uncharacterized protein NECHADRAFT_99093 [Fusarium vanettenii 77-13-4]EEU40083.1 predicted protein [Fusarium vanettenii 77-13-4]